MTRGKRKDKVRLTFGLYEDGRFVRRETITHDLIKVGRDPKRILRLAHSGVLSQAALRTLSFTPNWTFRKGRMRLRARLLLMQMLGFWLAYRLPRIITPHPRSSA